MNKQEKNDAAQGVFFREQLTLLEAAALEKKYPAKKGRMLVPVDNTGGPGVVFRKWRMFDRIGVAKAISEAGDDLPLVSLSGQEFQAKAKSYGIAVPFTEDEIEQAKFAGEALDGMKMNAARDGYEDTVDDLIFSGDSSQGVQGLLDHPNVPIYTPGTSAGAGDDTWPNKTSAEIVADVDSVLTGMRTLTKDTQIANFVGLSIERLALLARMPMGSGDTNYTVMKHLKETFPGVIFDSINRLSTAGVGGVQRMIAMQQDKDVLYFWEPQSFTFYPEQRQLFKRVIPAKGRVGGVIVRRPMAIAFMDGV
jgi:hypothetical protein